MAMAMAVNMTKVVAIVTWNTHKTHTLRKLTTGQSSKTMRHDGLYNTVHTAVVAAIDRVECNLSNSVGTISSTAPYTQNDCSSVLEVCSAINWHIADG